MALAPVARLKKAEIVWLANNRCKHSHTYLEHFNCFLTERPDGAPMSFRVGFFDIETKDFKASTGIMFGYCIKDHGGEILESWLTDKDYKKGKLPDKRVVENCIEDMRKFDVLVTYFGTRMDMPFVRTKALMNGLEFPEYGELIHLDLYYHIRNKFSLHSNRQEVACETLLGSTDKTRFAPKQWLEALFGSREAMDMIADHCRKDVSDLEKLYNKTIMFKKRLDRSA